MIIATCHGHDSFTKYIVRGEAEQSAKDKAIGASINI
ncbi:hypothetical protein F441_20831 [Phytophthora nicotianae CJ01A1]|uniref:Uncharacterized protein n=4 Tax=Phytophthora nicotianae TaxID=4792 RepID=V9DZ86_PHYNI|nr:hypothetical protein F443_20968 [Phytophthora nicotianae P1569]ETK72531.1 hypothetical protein L915_20375 [Phytophthora nicotianae]ETO60895.1 hypothetical protein F444_20974 [Phytophthora nicotianae P1976]ETP02006.1 hypothetical protein F441_20831 [Phytophthora nicotianae CJ01A1]ETL25985.1 hypothetical protein L916_20238 [Phytophthora nicotianae]